MIYKSQRIADEHKQLYNWNPRLHALINAVDVFTLLEMNKSITLTSIFRTAEEHKELYKNASVVPLSSPHCNWEAVDIRSFDFTEDQLKRIVGFANQFTFRNDKPVGMYHAIDGGAFHVHIQYGKSV